MSIGSFFTGIFHGVVDGLGAIGVVLGGIFGAIGGAGNWLLQKLSGGKLHIFPGTFKHTVLSSMLGWGSLFAVFSPYVRTHFVGPTVNQLARDFGAASAPGDVIPADLIGTQGGYDIVSTPASWGLVGPETIHDFALGSLIAEPWTTGLVPAADYSNGNLTVPPPTSSPGFIGAAPTP